MPEQRRRLARMVVNRNNLAESVHAEFQMSDAGSIQQGMREGFAPALASGEVKVPDVGPWLEFVTHTSAFYTREMTEADAAHVTELANDVRLRDRRDGLVDEVTEELKSLSDFFSGLFGKKALADFALDDSIAETPAGVLRQAQLFLRQAAKEPPEGRWKIEGFDLKAVTAKLESKTGELADILAQLHQEERKAQITVVKKHAAMEAWDYKFIRLMRFMEALYRLADLDEKARRLRPKIRQLGRRVAGDEADEQDAAAQSDSAPGEGASA